MSRIPYEMKQKDGFFFTQLPPPLSPPISLSSHENESTLSSSPSLGRNSPLLLLLLISVAAVVFISGLLHLLVRYLIKRPPSSLLPIHQPHNRTPETPRSHSHALQRQLQQLFRQHDSGLDQAVIDSLPVFYYKEIMGLKEPFDCAVCLCKFSDQDKLRLLATCSHAFHISCIDTWLLSNSTCPLCRGTLSSSSLPAVSSFDVLREISNGYASGGAENGFSSHQKPATTEESVNGPKRVFSVRLGKFKSLNGDNRSEREVQGQGEISRCNLDARRCYSMDTFQYVVADSDLQVALAHTRGCRDGVCGDSKLIKEKSSHGNSSVEEEDSEEKKISRRTRGESFSVSKIWLWSKKNRLPTSLDSHMALPSLSYYKFDNEH